MKRLSILLLVALLYGCTTQHTVKQASTEMTGTLVDLKQAQRDLQRLYLAEIDKTILLVQQSIISNRVQQTIKGLQQEEEEGDLLGISEKIYERRRSSQVMLDEFSNWVQDNLGDDDDASDKVIEFVSEVSKRYRRQADRLESTSPELASELREKADTIETLDPDTETGLATLVELYRAEEVASKRLGDLKTYLSVLAAIHETIDEWIQTEVTVSGEDVANLVQKHSSTLQLEDSNSEEVEQ
jgi:hypothetical protein